MNVTQPLTVISVEMPGSMPLTETWIVGELERSRLTCCRSR